MAGSQDVVATARRQQGTPYGRHTIGGAVEYVTKRLPDEAKARLKFS